MYPKTIATVSTIPRSASSSAALKTQPPLFRTGVTVGSTLTWPSTAAILARGARDPASIGGRLEPERGFEPLTYHLRGGCSA